MPIIVRKIKGGYRVTTLGGIKKKRTTKAKAQRQARLLRAVEQGFVPTRRK